MSGMPDITVTVIFHREGPLAIPALASMRDLVGTARASGLAVEARALIDRGDTLTRHIVAARGGWLDGVEEISAGDLGLARNAGVAASKGAVLACLDGDDLWGRQWLRLAMEVSRGTPGEAIWHPEVLYYFDEGDIDRHSLTSHPHPNAKSILMEHCESIEVDFDRDGLFLNNFWSANVFAPRGVHEAHPYFAVDRDLGIGIEDWTWNMMTVTRGVPHRVVPGTVHLIRVKETGSLGQQNASEGLLPRFPPDAFPRFGGG